MVFERLANSPTLESTDSPSFDAWNEQESEPELNELHLAHMGYVPLGTEIVQSVEDDDGDEDVEHVADADENSSEGESQTLSAVVDEADYPSNFRGGQVLSTENLPVEPNVDCLISDSLVDRLLTNHLEMTDLQPRGACSDVSIYTKSLPDSTQAHLWNTPCSKPDNIVLTQAKTDEIKNRMASFVMPKTVIPPWALQVPEELWKKKLLEKFHSERPS